MAYSVINNWDKPINQKRTFLCDARDDISSLPNQSTSSPDFPNGVPTGSDALCTADTSVWVLNNAGTWVEL